MSRDISLLNPNFRKKVELWLADNPEIFVTDAFRTKAEQQKLYAQGRTTPGPIVTWTIDSEHTKGKAVDVAFLGKELYPKDHKKREKIANSASTYGIARGYDLRGKDKPHFQDNNKPLSGPIPMHDYLEILIDELENDDKTLSQTIFEEYEGENTLKEKDIKALIALAIYRNNKTLPDRIKNILKGVTLSIK